MGLFSGLLGNASKKDNDKVERQLEGILIPGEQVELAYVLVRDLIVFTEKRLILVDKQGVTGKKTSYKSIPWAKKTMRLANVSPRKDELLTINE